MSAYNTSYFKKYYVDYIQGIFNNYYSIVLGMLQQYTGQDGRSVIAEYVENYVETMRSIFDGIDKQFRKYINFDSLEKKLEALIPEVQVALNAIYENIFSKKSEVFELSASDLQAGDVLGFYADGVSKIQVLNHARKVIATSKVDSGSGVVAIDLPSKYDGGDLFLKVYGKEGKSFSFKSFSIDDPQGVENVTFGEPASGAIQFDGDKDSYRFLDEAQFASVEEGGAGEFRVVITSSEAASLSAKLAKVPGLSVGKLATSEGVLTADISRTGSGEITKALTLEVSARKGAALPAEGMDYVVEFLADDIAGSKHTQATIDLADGASQTFSGAFAWAGDKDWIKLENVQAGETYTVSGLPEDVALKLFNARGGAVSDLVEGEISVTKGGTYFLEILDAGTTAGTEYSLDISVVGIALE